MVVYADTSFLFSLYADDIHSAKAFEENMALHAPIVFTAFHQHELHNALCLSMFRKETTIPQYRAVLASIAMDIQNGALVNLKVDWEEAYARAETLGEIHTPEIGCRASDILHVALAQMFGIECFYSFDIRQRSLAQKTGLIVKPK